MKPSIHKRKGHWSVSVPTWRMAIDTQLALSEVDRIAKELAETRRQNEELRARLFFADSQVDLAKREIQQQIAAADERVEAARKEVKEELLRAQKLVHELQGMKSVYQMAFKKELE